MKTTSLLTSLILALLSPSVTAIGPATPDQPPRLQGKPAPVPNWKWPNPFKSPSLATKYNAACKATGTFQAQQFMLDDLALEPPLGLLPYRDALRSIFSSREYPGSWDGIDPHGYDRILLTMDYEDVPLKVREWIEEQERTNGEGRGLFAVYGRPMVGTRVMDTIKVPEEAPVSEEWRARDNTRVVLFAPGALYEVLPIWVAEGSDCEDALMDLSKYSGKLADGGVIAYPVERTKPARSKNERDIKFSVEAHVLELKPGMDATEEEVEEVKVEETKAEETKAEESVEKDEL